MWACGGTAEFQVQRGASLGEIAITYRMIGALKETAFKSSCKEELISDSHKFQKWSKQASYHKVLLFLDSIPRNKEALCTVIIGAIRSQLGKFSYHLSVLSRVGGRWDRKTELAFCAEIHLKGHSRQY